MATRIWCCALWTARDSPPGLSWWLSKTAFCRTASDSRAAAERTSGSPVIRWVSGLQAEHENLARGFSGRVFYGLKAAVKAGRHFISGQPERARSRACSLQKRMTKTLFNTAVRYHKMHNRH